MSRLMFTAGHGPYSRPDRLAVQLAGHLGMTIREGRLRRRWSLRELARRAGLSSTFVHEVEAGHSASLESYTALAAALELRPVFDLVDPRARARTVRQADPVHAAMSEALSARLAGHGFSVALDEPYQHFQFAGRADVLARDVDRRSLLHVENRTRFPNIGETFGSYNAKRRYLPAAVAERLGLRRGFASVTNVIAALWSAEVLRELRRHRASFLAVCPDPAREFAGWLDGEIPPAGGATSTLVIFDPLPGGRADRRRVVGLSDTGSVRPRYRGYADAAEALRRADLAR